MTRWVALIMMIMVITQHLSSSIGVQQYQYHVNGDEAVNKTKLDGSIVWSNASHPPQYTTNMTHKPTWVVARADLPYVYLVNRHLPGPPSMDAPRRCLGLENITYPDDAYEHYQEIHRLLHEHTNHTKPHRAAGYRGPWIENYWIDHFKEAASHLDHLNFSSMFGPYIPLFVPWVDIWVSNSKLYPKGVFDALEKVLRKDVAYLTVSQSDHGLPGCDDPFHFKVKGEPAKRFGVPPNILVLSAGGYGHVPVPLFKQSERTFQSKRNRTWLVSYAGSLSHDPIGLRKAMNNYLENHFPTKYLYYYGKKWREKSRDSSFVLCPRGYGRTSYHLMETIQQGRIPIHVYSKVSWVPYERLFDKVGYSVSIKGLGELMERLEKISPEEVMEQEKTILDYRESHFMPSGVLHQIELFMKDDNKGDLVCRPLPATVRRT